MKKEILNELQLIVKRLNSSIGNANLIASLFTDLKCFEQLHMNGDYYFILSSTSRNKFTIIIHDSHSNDIVYYVSQGFIEYCY